MKVFALKITNKLDDLTSKSLLSVIEEKKRERLLKFVFWQDMHRSLFADLLIRKILIEEYNYANEEIYFTVNEYGKPYFDNLNDFHFNISHSGDWVVCAIDKKPIGIDIEEISTIDLDISKNFFSDKEHNDLLLSKDPFDYFFTLWSLKESYIKFLGKGLSHPLNSFSMRFLNERIVIESYDQILEKINFKQYQIDDAYKMALCSLNLNMPEDVLIYTISDLINTFASVRIVS
ncbi:MAG: 4'-phosphopantetheinyl transferase superfamily protein [Bacteroidales bacterium]|nr:4'-phosphopantetheinyl transferase superfamily protein [Bacteroidales bacterium]